MSTERLSHSPPFLGDHTDHCSLPDVPEFLHICSYNCLACPEYTTQQGSTYKSPARPFQDQDQGAMSTHHFLSGLNGVRLSWSEQTAECFLDSRGSKERSLGPLWKQFSLSLAKPTHLELVSARKTCQCSTCHLHSDKVIKKFIFRRWWEYTQREEERTPEPHLPQHWHGNTCPWLLHSQNTQP